MRNYVIIAIILISLAVFTAAQTQKPADWVGPLDILYTWDYKAEGFCPSTQCLTTAGKCIENGKWELDNICDSGKWKSRTKEVAVQLLAIALSNNPTNFSLYCNNYESVLNKYEYQTSYGQVTTFLKKFCTQPNGKTENCVNNVCAIQYGNNVAFGTALNTDISGDKSILKALDLSNTICDNAKNNDGDYDTCGNSVWYNHDKQSIIHAPLISALPIPTTTTNDFFTTPYNKLKAHVFKNVHNPDINQYNYTFFNLEPKFDKVYLAKHNFNFIYSFKQTNYELTQRSFIGTYLSNIDLPANACKDLFKTYGDSRADCEVQPSSTEFYLTAWKQSPTSIVDAWEEIIKIRVGP